jgi:hypothetical protein
MGLFRLAIGEVLMSYNRYRIEEIQQVLEEDLRDIPFMYSIHYAYADSDELTTEVGMNCRPIFAEGFVRDDARVDEYFEYEPPVNYEMTEDSPLSDLITDGLSNIIDGPLEKIEAIISRSDDDAEVSGICVTLFYLDDPSRPEVYYGKRQVYALCDGDTINNHDQAFETVMVLMRDFGMGYLEDLVRQNDRFGIYVQ